MNDEIKTRAIKRLRKLQSSSRYRSFLNVEAVEAFAKVGESAYAGRSLDRVAPNNKAIDPL